MAETWQNRVQDAVIETAAGDRFVFEFRDIGYERTERTEIFKFSDRKDYVQRNHSGSYTFDLELFFSGADCDIKADTFEQNTRDTRPLKFTHPLQKKTYLVQLISLRRNDRLATRANEVAFTVKLHETIDLAEKPEEANVTRYVDQTVSELNLRNSDWAKNKIESKDPSALRQLASKINDIEKQVAKMAKAYEVISDFAADLESVILSFENLMETPIANMVSIIGVFQGLIEMPAKVLRNVKDRLAFYAQVSGLLDAIKEDSDPIAVQATQMAAAAGSATAAVSGTEDTYITKDACFAQAEKINALIADIRAFAESDEENALSEQQYELIDKLGTLAAANLERVAFKAKQTRIYRVTKDCDIYPLAYRLLGGNTPDELDNYVNQLIDINQFGRGLFEIKAGTEVKYYL